jgi:hypothetical protein
MRPLNQSHQRAVPKKFSRMQASLSKFCVTTVSSSLTLLHFNKVVHDAAHGSLQHSRRGANFNL